jgi:hypothetical protein
MKVNTKTFKNIMCDFTVTHINSISHHFIIRNACTPVITTKRRRFDKLFINYFYFCAVEVKKT